MAQHDGQVTDAGDGVINPVLVLGIERTEITGDGQSIYVVLDFGDLSQNARQVQLRFLPPVEIVPAPEIVELGRGEPPLHLEVGNQLRIIADQQQRDPLALPLGDGICGQGGRDGDHFDGRWVLDMDPIDHHLDTDREVALRGQALM
jgi:hypothetical protein